MTIPFAPGWPGLVPNWTSSAKIGVGTALSLASHVWFTLSHGILNEIYYPRLDQACTRDFGLIVTDGQNFFSEEKRQAIHQVEKLEEGLPAFRLVNTCRQDHYRIEKLIFSDPDRETVLQVIHFTPLRNQLEDYRLYALLAPHLGNHGSGNTAWVADYKGQPLLLAQREGVALALLAGVGRPFRGLYRGLGQLAGPGPP
jgi:glucoamylase